MLSNPNVREVTPKVGNRYEAALAIAKRARNIEQRRVIEGDKEIKDAVDIAAKEIANEEVLVKKDGKYVIEQKEEKEVVVADETDISDIVKE